MTNIKNIKQLPSGEEIVREIPLSRAAAERVRRDRAEICDVLAGRDARMLVIVGPCSAWPSEAVLEFAAQLRDGARELASELKLVLRTYIQKPRTTKGWTGPVNQPDPFAPPDIAAGMRYARRMMVEVVEMGLPIADEAVFTHNARGFAELLAWVAIGARSSEDQEHRIWASAVEAPVGIKNPTSGCIPNGVNGVLAAQHPHVAVFDGHQVETSGNPFAHLVLRGGAGGPNYFLHDLYRASKLITSKGLKNPAILVDASHDNCKMDGVKHPGVQVDVVREVLSNLRVHPELLQTVKGFMIESFLKSGSQPVEQLTRESVDRGGLSITDPCLSWPETKVLLADLASQVADLRASQLRKAASS